MLMISNQRLRDLLLLSTIIYIVTLCRRKGSLEVGNTVLSHDVVPLEQLLDVAVTYTVTVVARKSA